MKKTFIVIATLTAMCGLSYAQNSFDTELSNLRKNVISMCAQLQAGKPKESQEQLLKEIDSIINAWLEMKKKYTENIPPEYSKDPEWKNYFDEVEDNFRIMRQKVEERNYKRASHFCGQNCALFVKIHNVNGRTTLADAMFTMRQNMKLAVSMAKADNWKGAKNAIGPNKGILKGLRAMCPENKTKEFNVDLKILIKINKELEDTIKERNTDKLNNQFKQLLRAFNGIYLKYI
ncbi:MAG: hypothetical protein ACPL28_08515 [bacterium]